MPGNDRFTVALLHCDGTNLSTSFPNVGNAFPGAQPPATATGAAQVTTGAFKFPTGSMNVDAGANSQVHMDGSAGFSFGTGDFTIDFWVAFAARSGISTLYDGRSSGGSELTPVIYTTTTDNFIHFFTGAADILVSTSTVTDGVFYHIAWSRQSGTSRLFFNGNLQASTGLDTNNYTIGASRPSIGGNGNGPTANGLFGDMDEIRVSKGVARWTAAFTPPVVPYDEWEPGFDAISDDIVLGIRNKKTKIAGY